ncbi:MAG: peptidoglycan-binding protein [Candidatus Pacebacteria bacterium]|nr:peptidoglycan-binding protein [Candidatus Paceibacterota bacterium]
MTSTNKIAKLAAIVAGSALVAMSFAAAIPAAHAQTTTTTTSTLSASQVAALQAQIASLQAQLSAATGTSSTGASVTFTRDLTVGSTGSDVTALQTWLISHGDGQSIAAGATGYFGAQTKAALAAFQSQNGISPAAGYFGPITRAKVNSMSGSTTTTTTTTTTGSTTTLSGAEGSIDNFQSIGASSSTFNAGDTEQVMGFGFKADGSDLAINRVNFDVVLTSLSNTSTGSPRPWNFFQTATLMDGNTTIGTVDASNAANWSQDGQPGNYQQYRISFQNLNDVVKMGSTADYYLSFTTQSAISDSNAGGTYTVTLPSQGLRATDALGIQQYNDTTDTATFTITNSQNGSVVISQASDNPQTSSVQGDTSSVTNGVTLNAFTIQAKNSNITLYSIPVTLNTSLATSSYEVRDLKLYQGSTLLDTESVSSSATSPVTVTFKNMNFKIPQGTTDEFSVQADINKIDGSTFTNGATASVNVNPGNTADIENSSGNTVNLTGASTGNTITFYSTGISVDSTPTTSAVAQTLGNSSTQLGTFTFTFNVTAFGEDIYLSSTTNGFTGSLYDQGGNTVTATTSISSTADRTSGSTNNYVIHNGQTKQVTVSFTKSGGNAYYYGKLSTLHFGTADTGTSGPLSQTFTFPTSYQTTQIYLNS